MPDVGTSRQPMMFMMVDLPEPEGPMMAVSSPLTDCEADPCKRVHLDVSHPVDLRDIVQFDYVVLTFQSCPCTKFNYPHRVLTNGQVSLSRKYWQTPLGQGSRFVSNGPVTEIGRHQGPPRPPPGPPNPPTARNVPPNPPN